LSVSEIDFKCANCSKEATVYTISGKLPACMEKVCCECCIKQGFQTKECETLRKELERLEEGKELTQNEVKGLLLEKAVSDALYALKIPHDHNPFTINYPCYQNKRPDIVIKEPKLVIECKNLSQNEVEHWMSKKWLNENIVKREYFKGYRKKIVVFSYMPPKTSLNYLHRHGWKVYSLGTQLLTLKAQNKSIGKMKQKFYWLTKYQQSLSSS